MADNSLYYIERQISRVADALEKLCGLLSEAADINNEDTSNKEES